MSDSLVDTLPFEQIWLGDTEYNDTEVVCVCALEWRSGQRVALSQGEFGRAPPYQISAADLFVCYAGNAELGTHLQLGWPLPHNVIDLNAEFRVVANGRPLTPNGYKLIGALEYYGLETIGSQKKDIMRDRILRGGPWSQQEMREIIEYCMSDVIALARLLPCVLADARKLPFPR